MVAELYDNREWHDAVRRPIVFVCHGWGHVILKAALMHSKFQKGSFGLHSIYLSTHGIIFIDTPYDEIEYGNPDEANQGHNRLSQPCLESLLNGSGFVEEIDEQFSALESDFEIVKLTTKSMNGACPSDQGTPNAAKALRQCIQTARRNVPTRWNDSIDSSNNQMQTASLQAFGPPLECARSQGCNKWSLGVRNPSINYTGRLGQLKQVSRMLGAVHCAPPQELHRVLVLYGLGGSGKTQFCLKYIEENKGRYPGILWIDASTEEKIKLGYAALGQYAGKGDTYEAGHHWLGRFSKPWLLILDNADDPALDIYRFLPTRNGRHSGHILITTRNPRMASIATAGSLQFGKMDAEEAVDLLLKTAAIDDDASHSGSQNRGFAQDLAHHFGYLALALAQVGSFIRNGIPLDKCLSYFLREQRSLVDLFQEQSAEEASLFTTLEIRIRQMEQSESINCRDAVGLLHIFAFMHFEAIPIKIFERSWHSIELGRIVSSPSRPNLGFMVDEPAWNAGPSVRLRRAISVLTDCSLIECNFEQGLCSLHPLVHTWARCRLGEKQVEWLECTSSVLAYAISPHLEASERKLRRALLPHIESCLSALSERFRVPTHLAQATEIEKFATVYVENGLWDQALRWQRKIADYRTATLGSSHESTLQAQRSLAETYWNLFDVMSCIQVQTMKLLVSCWLLRPFWMCCLSWPPWLPNYVLFYMVLDDITRTLWLLRQLDWSSFTGEIALRGLRKRLGPDDPITLSAMFNLARTYLHRGSPWKSQPLLIEVTKKRKHFFGNEHPDTLMARNELGMCLYTQKRSLEAAENMVSNVFESRKRILGDEHAYTLWSANDLAKVLCERRCSQRAITLLEETLSITTRTLHESHIGTMMTKWNLARAYCLQERWEDAERLLLSLLARMETAFPNKDHPNWIDLTSGYVYVLLHRNQLQEAEHRCKTMLDKILAPRSLLSRIIKPRALGRRSPRTIAIAEQLLVILRERGCESEAWQLQKTFPGINSSVTKESFDMMPIKRIKTGMED